MALLKEHTVILTGRFIRGACMEGRGIWSRMCETYRLVVRGKRENIMRIRIYQCWVCAGCRQPQALCSSRGCDESVSFLLCLRMGPYWRPLALQCQNVHPPSPVVIGITQVSHSGCIGVAPWMRSWKWLTTCGSHVLFFWLAGLKSRHSIPFELHL